MFANLSLPSRQIGVLKKRYFRFGINEKAVRGIMTANKCWECKHNTLKLKILVPHNRTIKEYVHRTGDFQSDIVAIVKEKQGQYTVWFRSDGDIKLLTFRILHVCRLKCEQNKKDSACGRYQHKDEQNIISNIIYSKVPAAEIAQTVAVP